jgi:hypothetical protein
VGLEVHPPPVLPEDDSNPGPKGELQLFSANHGHNSFRHRQVTQFWTMVEGEGLLRSSSLLLQKT